jgi:hypothetical protein
MTSSASARRSRSPPTTDRTHVTDIQGGQDGPGKLEIRTEERINRPTKRVERQWPLRRTLCVQSQRLKRKRGEREVAFRRAIGLVKLPPAHRIAQRRIPVEPGVVERRAEALQQPAELDQEGLDGEPDYRSGEEPGREHPRDGCQWRAERRPDNRLGGDQG